MHDTPHLSGAIATETARRVLATEASGLTYLADNLPADFSAVVEAILGLKGRVIVSGIGKSGHVGNKIAATLASTGTPASFVHAAEASHGDLGMITRADLCILISRSGETAELKDLIYHAQRFSIGLVGISQDEGSTLMRAADYRLTLPDLPEACAIGMAPTTSTTLTMALGDALAVALMETRGFKAEDFNLFHPGGKLGAQMLKVRDLMHREGSIPLAPHDASLSEVVAVMTDKGFGIAGLVEDGRLRGVVTDGDLRRNIERLSEVSLSSIASVDPVTVVSDCLAAEALALLNERKITALMVVDDGRPVGILHLHDLLRAGVM